jgi:hypothetical protein
MSQWVTNADLGPFATVLLCPRQQTRERTSVSDETCHSATSRWNRFRKRPFIVKRYVHDQLSFNGVSRNVPFTPRIFREHNTSRWKAPHVPIASFELDLARQPKNKQALGRVMPVYRPHPRRNVANVAPGSREVTAKAQRRVIFKKFPRLQVDVKILHVSLAGRIGENPKADYAVVVVSPLLGHLHECRLHAPRTIASAKTDFGHAAGSGIGHPHAPREALIFLTSRRVRQAPPSVSRPKWVIHVTSVAPANHPHVRCAPFATETVRQCNTSLRARRRHRPSYSITSSARASSEGGTMRPNALAAVKLMMRSNLVGCSTGRSAGFAPRNILST